MDTELEAFKTLSLVDVAINSFSYELDLRDSCRSSKVLRSGGDKLVVSKHKTLGHDVYFGRDPADRGTVIDLVNFRVRSNDAKLIPVRQLLRGYMPSAKLPVARRVSAEQIKAMAPVVVEKDLAAIQDYVDTLAPYTGTYLTVDRGLSECVMQYFPVYVDEKGNAIFLHHNSDGDVCGFEIKNRPPAGSKHSFTGFAEGGVKSLFIGRVGEWDEITQIVVAESAIDVISYADMNFRYGTLYVSTGGSVGQAQREHLICLFDEFQDAQFVMAMDNDEFDKQGNVIPHEERPGNKMAYLVRSLALPGSDVIRAMPKRKDWNDDLRAELAKYLAKAA